MRGINQEIKIAWNENTLDVNPGIDHQDYYTGISTKITFNESAIYTFNFDLDLNGSESLNFIPIGKQTNVKIHSDWANPSFEGSFLPDERTIEDTGFNANWQVLHLNRTYPQQWLNDAYDIDNSAFGVKLLLAVDHYQKSLRSVKYAIMFISLTFLIFFFSEILNKKRIHPIQYLLI